MTTVAFSTTSSAPCIIAIQFKGGTPMTVKSNGNTVFQLNQGTFTLVYNISAQAQRTHVTVTLTGGSMRPIVRDVGAYDKGVGVRTVNVS